MGAVPAADRRLRRLPELRGPAGTLVVPKAGLAETALVDLGALPETGVTDRLLTARELAEHLSISTGALLRWTRAGKVPHVKLPSGAVRYRPDAIAAWLDESEQGAAGGQELTTTGAEPRPSEAYVRLSSIPTTTRPPDAADEQEDHDGRT